MGMNCPFCASNNTKVLESRLLDDAMRRRRECLGCSTRFTTYERAFFHLSVLKKDGREQPFNLAKITTSIQQALGKVEEVVTNEVARRVERKVLKRKTNLIKTKDIGRYVLTELKRIDKMAYLRFASIHKAMDDPRILEKELQTIVR
jgi:transcriptional repressor NrdR